jgi:glycogen operon protein
MTVSFTVHPGKPEPLGVTVEPGGLNVAVVAPDADAVEIVLFDADGHAQVGSAVLPARRAGIHHGFLKGPGAGTRYGLRAYGPYAPERGLRFNPAKLLVDPYARALDRPFVHDPSLCGTTEDGSLDPRDTADLVPKAIATAPIRATPRPFAVNRLEKPPLVYELHVKGFSQTHPAIPEALRGTVAALAHPAAVDHLSGLGVTTVELMPIMAWIDERHLPALGLTDYWGYNTMAFMAPDPRLAPGGIDDVRKAVAALHAAGIEVILDIVLNHTGESDELGATLSFRGLDNAGYYRLDPHDRTLYVNDTGCGNTVALDRPHTLRLAMDAMRYWAIAAGVDGFRFDLATTLGRRMTGFDPEAPLFQAIEQDPILRGLKMIAEPWDVGPGGHRLGAMPPRWSEWNDRYRDTVRRFWRGEDGIVGDLATRLTGSADLFAGARRPPSASVNFIAAHDGFPLADVVAYTRKHNHANGEDNRDGHGTNYSWNHGVEGPSDGPDVTAARDRDVANLLVTLFVSRGLPMLAMGDELGRTQHGNNNAYAQDNDTAWIDWSTADADRIALVRKLSDLRRRHPALRTDAYLSGHAVDERGLPDIEWRTVAGHAMAPADWDDPATRSLVAIAYAATGGASGGDRVAIAFNAGDTAVTATLPPPRDGHGWRVVVDTGAADRIAGRDLDGVEVTLSGHGAAIVAEVAERGGRTLSSGARATEPRVLDRLSEAAGIAPEWFGVVGDRHVVSPETRRALLDSMGLPAATNEAAHASLAVLSRAGARRPLPPLVVAEPGTRAIVAIPREPNGRPPRALHLRLEDGAEEIVPIPLDAAQDEITAPDGGSVRRTLVRLPKLPFGDHRIRLDEREEREATARLIVTPRACYRPPVLDQGRRFGLQANLYSLERDGDQGVGDFATLAALGADAGALGAAAVGINPLHMLFPGDRERASPYHPSDRRFLDPIYLDIDAIADMPDQARPQQTPTRLIDYPAVWEAKRAALEAAFDRFRHRPTDDAERRAFEAFLTRRGRPLISFATYQVIAEDRPGVPWMRWPSPLRRPNAPGIGEIQSHNPGRVLFQCWLQWQAERQFEAAARHAEAAGLSIGIYRDLAVGSAPDGAEAWAEQDHLAERVSIGAPPDPFSAHGQIWVARPPVPHRMRDLGYRPFSGLLSANMLHAGLLRLDHVMGLSRLYCVPDGAPAADGAYVGYQLDEQLAVLSLASHRHRCGVVGEDLGTVQEGLGERLAEAEVLSTRVVFFEREADGGFRPPAAYKARAATCAATHDLPTIAGWWSGHDIDVAAKLGRTADADAARTVRRGEREALLAALAHAGIATAGLPDADDATPATEALAALVAAVHAFLAETPSDLVLLQTTDLATETEPVNVPGTDREWPNWRQRLGHALTRTELAARLPEAYRARGLTTAPGPQSPQSPEPAAPTSGPEE